MHGIVQAPQKTPLVHASSVDSHARASSATLLVFTSASRGRRSEMPSVVGPRRVLKHRGLQAITWNSFIRQKHDSFMFVLDVCKLEA